ncbi:hypothetical protein ACFLXE_00040 [Chloroflexota bacterium]
MLNREAFLLIAGDTSEWDRKLQEAADSGSELVDVQKQQYRDGFRCAELLRSMYGWYVRSGTGLNDFVIMYIPTNHSQQGDKGFAEAVHWGRQWVSMDSENREFYVRRYTLELEADEVSMDLLVEPCGMCQLQTALSGDSPEAHSSDCLRGCHAE